MQLHVAEICIKRELNLFWFKEITYKREMNISKDQVMYQYTKSGSCDFFFSLTLEFHPHFSGESGNIGIFQLCHLFRAY